MNINFLVEFHNAAFVFTSNTCLESVWCAFEVRMVFGVLHASHSMVSKLAGPTLLSHFISRSRSPRSTFSGILLGVGGQFHFILLFADLRLYSHLYRVARLNF